jgi:hypothetical protein
MAAGQATKKMTCPMCKLILRPWQLQLTRPRYLSNQAVTLLTMSARLSPTA